VSKAAHERRAGVCGSTRPCVSEEVNIGL
jgi:hypothetical protein